MHLTPSLDSFRTHIVFNQLESKSASFSVLPLLSISLHIRSRQEVLLLQPSHHSQFFWAEEEKRLFLPTRGEVLGVEVEGQGLSTEENASRMPRLEEPVPGGIWIQLTDWVGHLTFSVIETSGVTEHPCLIFPGKLSREREEAFTALARLTDTFPDLTLGLGFPQELLPNGDLNHRRPLPVTALLPYAGRAGQWWQEARRLPRASLGHTRRVVHGGAVPDRVEWDMTLDHWALGGFPDHIARDLNPLPPPTATAALHGLWDTLIQAAQLSYSPEAPGICQRFEQAKDELPARPAADPVRPDALCAAVQADTFEVQRLVAQARGLPRGWTRMAALYELWAMLTFARILGATEGAFHQGRDGLYEGTLHGKDLTVQLNPKLSFHGNGARQRSVQPDILVLFESGEALVADVKYRPLHTVPTEDQGKLDGQVLRYMGLSHARTGLLLWPGRPGERVWRSELPGGRAQLARLRLHPLDSPEQQLADLKQLNLPGVH